jgi:hypothetical protein
VILLYCGFVYAGISVTPDRHIVSLMPGEETAVMYHIDNSGTADIDITIEPKAWSGMKDPYKWLSLESDTIYAKAGELTSFIVNLKAPEDEKGEMMAMLFLCYKESVGSQLNIRNGIPLYMVIKDTEYYDLNIEDMHISYSRIDDFYDLNFVVKIKNTGNIHIVPDVKVIVKNDKGKTLNTMALKEPNIVLRDKNHAYRLMWREPGLRDGIYKATVELNYEDKIEPKVKDIRFQVTGSRIEQLETEKAGD